MSEARRVLLLVENQPVPRDRRVWPECMALRERGYAVTVVCPVGTNGSSASYERLNGVEIHRYRPSFGNGSALGYAREYATALWRTARLVRRLARPTGFDVVHAANPPDVLLLAALPLRRRGTRFVFDHHDVVPELYVSRFGNGRRLLLSVVRLLERLNFRLADVVIATNESYRRIAVERGGKRPEDVFVVRNAPGGDRASAAAAPELKRGRPHLLAYMGMMEPQDGVDVGIRALAALAERRRDWHAIFVGAGSMLEPLRGLVAELGLDEHVEFTGFVDDPHRINSLLTTADVCLAPEPKNPHTEVSTLIKVAEYMAMGRPIVSFDLCESRFTAGRAALYALPNDEGSFAACVDRLLDDPALRARMGAVGRARVRRMFSWEQSKRELYAAYERALSVGGNGV